MAKSRNVLLGIIATFGVYLSGADAYWRMSCGLIQTGRLDPNISPGAVSGHVHKVSGASNFYLANTYEDLVASQCTSCEIQDDKSAYWTPQLYYEHANGSFEEVPNGGTVVYYLGRGENRSNIEPFPPGFRMVSGDPYLRSNDTISMTYSEDNNVQGRPISGRVSFNCLDSSGSLPEQNYMFRTDCDNGLRAQIQFQSCWDGRDYQPDQSHVAYMSGIDNGVCPPSHPRQLVHLFFEVYYGVNDVQKEDGGRFVFANGDPTGFGFHGDFMNGWDPDVLREALGECANNDTSNGQVSSCPPLAKSQTPYYATNCPERKAIVNEQVKGLLECLPGCNVVTTGPERAMRLVCPDDTPTVNSVDKDQFTTSNPSIGQMLDGSTFAFAGCVADSGNPRTLDGYSFEDDNMTVEHCTSTCKAKGYLIAGLEYSTECYCGTSVSSAVTSVDCSTTPKMICAGDATHWCGAPNLLTVWNDTSYSKTAATSVVNTTTINSGSATYMGCFSDPGANNRALVGATKVDAAAMTNEMCASYCQDKGYSLAGTEYGQECYCGNVNTGTIITDDSQCSMKCAGDSPRACGAGLKLSVWALQAAPSQSRSAQPEATQTQSVQTENAFIRAANGTAIYMGCYTDSASDGRTLAKDSYSNDNMTVDSCAAYCQAKNYALFGMEYSRECYCDNAPKTSSALSAEGDCNMACKGNSSQICGGGSRISIYNNTLYAATHNLATASNGGYAYVGCYAEGTSGRALGIGAGAASTSDSTSDAKMTVEKCAGYCAGKGYEYMGVEYGQECYCNNDGPLNGATKAGEGDCSMTCSGDVTEWCGGSSRISVYSSSV